MAVAAWAAGVVQIPIHPAANKGLSCQHAVQGYKGQPGRFYDSIDCPVTELMAFKDEYPIDEFGPLPEDQPYHL